MLPVLSVQMTLSLGSDVKPLALSPHHTTSTLLVDVEEPTSLFKKSKQHSPLCCFATCSHAFTGWLGGWEEIMKAPQTPLHADV